MCTSSSSSKDRGNCADLGQMTLTDQPARANVVASSHTRRSNGTGRFCTTIRTRRLPADAFVDKGPLLDAALAPHQVDQALVLGERGDRPVEGRVVGADHNRL